MSALKPISENRARLWVAFAKLREAIYHRVPSKRLHQAEALAIIEHDAELRRSVLDLVAVARRWHGFDDELHRAAEPECPDCKIIEEAAR
jgi:hypothetical protein